MSQCPHCSLFENRNLLKILIKLDLEKSLNQFNELFALYRAEKSADFLLTLQYSINQRGAG
jgi:hypothetical protein